MLRMTLDKAIHGSLNDVKRAVTSLDRKRWGNRIRYVYQCQVCFDWFPKKLMEVNHIIPVGGFQDIATEFGPWVLRLLVERPGLQPTCSTCHSLITEEQRNAKNDAG